MFTNGDVSLMTWMLLIFGPLLIVIALFFSVRAREFIWPNIAVLGIALAVLLLPSVQKFSIGKECGQLRAIPAECRAGSGRPRSTAESQRRQQLCARGAAG